MKVYLINQYDKWCPENNDGDYIVGVASSEEEAEKLIKRIKKEDEFDSNGYSTMEFFVDKTLLEAFTIREKESNKFVGD